MLCCPSRRSIADRKAEERNRPMADKLLLVAGYAVDARNNHHTQP